MQLSKRHLAEITSDHVIILVECLIHGIIVCDKFLSGYSASVSLKRKTFKFAGQHMQNANHEFLVSGSFTWLASLNNSQTTLSSLSNFRFFLLVH